MPHSYINVANTLIEHGKKVYENIVQIFSNIRKTVEYKTWLCNNLSKKGGASITILGIMTSRGQIRH
jgi:hypothetical protein